MVKKKKAGGEEKECYKKAMINLHSYKASENPEVRILLISKSAQSNIKAPKTVKDLGINPLIFMEFQFLAKIKFANKQS